MRSRPWLRAAAGLARFAPPVLWMGIIAVGSSSPFGADHTGGWMAALFGRLLAGASPLALAALHVALRKLGHLVEYGVLAVLWRRALAPRPRAVAAALALAAAYAALDEARQDLVPNRTASPLDVLVDIAGAALALAAWEGARPGPRALRVAGGAAALVAALALAGAALEAALGRAPLALGGSAVGLLAAAAGLGRAARLVARAPGRVSSGSRPPAPPMRGDP
jgi:VanZ family protein